MDYGASTIVLDAPSKVSLESYLIVYQNSRFGKF